ncbi:long-chain fatty acid--CoA ligase [Rhodococcus spelaei]|uniref:Acyl-CoA synthetase n=1 Tax=Rhodococcus spelaei TaxID=2546320 RepID=A0A541BM84_9NOCA|nr:AMP-dependent synthetase/ligase [Rhodococcus spelaei]TQF73420.1 long-chain fatty acid--CoA ligase [Rhodococcus spelaei]
MNRTIAGNTLADLTFRAAEAYGDRPAARYQCEPDTWEQVTYTELADRVADFGAGLIDLGLAVGDRVAVLGSTRLDWSVAHLAIVAAGAVHVSVYPTNSPEECAWVLGNSEARAVVCENAEQVAKVAAVRDQLPALEWVIVLDGEAGGAVTADEIRRRGRECGPEELHRRAGAVTPDDPYVFMYTSGTTGPPKGCVLSHANYRSIMTANTALEEAEGSSSDADMVLYLFLPLAHAFALLFQLLAFDRGGVIAYWGGDTARIVPEVMAVRPTHLPSVPRVFEKVYTLAVGSKPAEERERILAAAALGVRVRDLVEAGEEVPAELQTRFDAADTALFQGVRALFGGNVELAITGAAPIAKEILEFFYGCGVPVMEGFGMTETSTGATVNTPRHHRFGTVGRPLPGIEAKTAEDGELLLRGGNIFQGYYKMADASFGAVSDGWLHTGDLASIDEDGYVSIIGRKKDIIVTSGGKNLTPANLENDLKRSPWISQAIMHGDRRPYPVVLVTLDPETVLPWAQAQGLPDSIAELSRHPRVLELVAEAVDAANAKLAPPEQVKKFAVAERDLSQETGELTPTLKIKRKVVGENFTAEFDALYGD